MDVRECSACKTTRALDEFAKSARAKSGRRGVCKPCEREATRARRADERVGRRPGALVLAPNFPTPPDDTQPTDAGHEPATQRAQPSGVGNTSFSEAAEEFVAALDPPAGPADALLVRSLRGLAELLDRFSYGLDVVKDTNSLVTSLVRVQRELAATRSSKAKVAAPAVEAPPRRAANY